MSERIDRVLDIAERASQLVSFALTAVLMVQMLGDLLGIDVIRLVMEIARRPWIIPVELIEAYRPLWTAMQWILLTIMLADQVVVNRFRRIGREPPLEYQRTIALITFILSFWLAIVLRYMSYTVIAIFSSIALAYTMMKGGEE